MTFEVPERYNASTLLDDNLAAGRGERVAIRTEQGDVTYAELQDRMCRAARHVRSNSCAYVTSPDSVRWATRSPRPASSCASSSVLTL